MAVPVGDAAHLAGLNSGAVVRWQSRPYSESSDGIDGQLDEILPGACYSIQDFASPAVAPCHTGPGRCSREADSLATSVA